MAQLTQHEDRVREFRLQPFLSLSGLGLHIIRMIRNDFAHGSSEMPRPEDWSSGDKNETLTPREEIHLSIIDTCSRLLLLTQQMIMWASMKNENDRSEVLSNEDGFHFTANTATVLWVLHMRSYPGDRNQLSFFGSDLEYTY